MRKQSYDKIATILYVLCGFLFILSCAILIVMGNLADEYNLSVNMSSRFLNLLLLIAAMILLLLCRRYVQQVIIQFLVIVGCIVILIYSAAALASDSATYFSMISNQSIYDMLLEKEGYIAIDEVNIAVHFSDDSSKSFKLTEKEHIEQIIQQLKEITIRNRMFSKMSKATMVSSYTIQLKNTATHDFWSFQMSESDILLHNGSDYAIISPVDWKEFYLLVISEYENLES